MSRAKRSRASRPSASQRGYGGEHRRLRAQWAPKVAAGTVRCARGAACKQAELIDEQLVGGLIDPASTWDLGHDDRDRGRYLGPEHAECNRATMSHRPPRRRPDEPHPGLTPGG